MRPTIPIAAVLVTALVSTAWAATIRVPQDQPTLAAAVDAASNGDLIKIAAGEHVAAVTVTGFDGLTIRGSKGTVLNANAQDFAIRVWGSTDVRLEKLTMHGATDACVVVVESDRTTIRRCVMEDAEGGVWVDDSNDVTIDRCTIEGINNGGNGITDGWHQGTPTGLVVSRTQVRETQGRGISIESDGATVERCVIEDIGDHVSDEGLRIDGVRATVVRCDVVNTVGVGIALYGAEGSVTRCTTADTGNDGVSTFDADSPVDRCRVTRAGTEGIETDGPRSPITRCRVDTTVRDGVASRGADSRIDRCKVVDAGQAGIQADSDGISAESSPVTRCKVVNARNAGIIVYDAGADVDRCKVTGAGGHGVYVRGAAAVSKTKIKNAGEDGLHFDTTGASATGVTVKGSGNYGLYALQDSNTFTKVKVSGSAVTDLRDDTGPGGNTYAGCRFADGSTP